MWFDLTISVFRHQNHLLISSERYWKLQLTGLRIPGTAALAMMADQMMQFGAVRWLSKIVGLYVSMNLRNQRDIRMTIRRYDGYVQCSTSTLVSLFEGE